ncbi:MAG: FMN-binding protein [Actinobacteria bacterium]|jgi:hypothetical protein|nr:FMN-binding protein [Actinomycetota bacterium]
MKRGIFIASAAVVGGIGAFVFPAGAYMPGVLVGESPAPLVNPSGSPTPSSSATNPQSRTLVGDTINTRYGAVQIQLKVSGTTIDAVEILQAPSGSNARFTNYAIPILIRETLKAQSANVNSVSGASYTSQGFIQSLQSAFSQM